METLSNDGEEQVFGPSSLVERRKLNWSAIFAGVVAALGLQLLLVFFGGALGLAVMNPYEITQTSSSSLIAPLLWLAIVAIGSYFFGAWVAGHWANLYEAEDACIHGALTWALGTLIMALGVGSILQLGSQAAQATAQSAQAVQQMGADLTTTATNRSEHQSPLSFDSLDDKRFTAFVLERAKAWSAANPPPKEAEPLSVAVEQKQTGKADKGVDPQDIANDDELIAFVAANTKMNEERAAKFVDADKETIAKAENLSKQHWQKDHARELAQAEKVRRAASSIAWTMTGLSVLALIAAIGGSYLGWRQRYATEEELEVEESTEPPVNPA